MNVLLPITARPVLTVAINNRRNLTPLAATRDIENVKAAKYSSVASERGARFMAFIVESHGALESKPWNY